MFPAHHHLIPFRSFPMTSLHGACFNFNQSIIVFSQSIYLFMQTIMYQERKSDDGLTFVCRDQSMSIRKIITSEDKDEMVDKLLTVITVELSLLRLSEAHLECIIFRGWFIMASLVVVVFQSHDVQVKSSRCASEYATTNKMR